MEALPVDQLGLVILNDLIETNEWNGHNYLNAAENAYGKGLTARAIAEAMAWLRSRALIARTPGQTSDSAIFVSRTDHMIAEEGPLAFCATEHVQVGIDLMNRASGRTVP